jgi:hypothetical protein
MLDQSQPPSVIEAVRYKVLAVACLRLAGRLLPPAERRAVELVVCAGDVAVRGAGQQ